MRTLLVLCILISFSTLVSAQTQKIDKNQLTEIATNYTNWEIYFPETQKTYDAVVLENSPTRLVFLYQIYFDSMSKATGFIQVWDKLGRSYWSYTSILNDWGELSLIEKPGPEVFKLSASTTKESVEVYGQTLRWTTMYLINKSVYVDKSKLR